MKKVILLAAFLLITSSGVVNAQRFVDASNINISGGYLISNGFNASLEYEKMFTDNRNSLFTGVEFSTVNESLTTYPEYKISIKNYLFNIGYRRYFDFSGNGKLFPFLGGGLFCGKEDIDRNETPSSVYIGRKEILYGAKAMTGIEYDLTVCSLFGGFSFNYEINNKDYKTSIFAGAKLYF